MAVIRALYVYPVKSCGGIALDQAQLLAEGLKWDRNWMVVDEAGQLATQRQYAAMARIVCAFAEGGVRLSTNGSSLFLPFEPQGDERRVRATVWKDTVDAFDAGDEAAQRTRAVHRVEALTCDELPRLPAHVQCDPAVAQSLSQVREQQVDDQLDLRLRQWLEQHDVVDAGALEVD